jgi:hypothetical protein
MKNASIGGHRLEALREREASLKAAIAAEVEVERKRKAREHERVVRIVGEALLEESERSPNFRTMLRQSLNIVADEKARRLLTKHGLL